MVYLDHNATTPLDGQVLEAMMPYLASYYGNPSTLYRSGRLVRDAIETARAQVACLVGAQSAEVIFTSGGTEANNLAIKGFSWKEPGRAALLVGATEHDSVLAPAEWLEKAGWGLDKVSVDDNGLINEARLAASASGKTRLVSIMMANNETGVIQDIESLAEWTKKRGIIFHTDAVQVAGKLPIDFRQIGVQMMTLSAHKMYGPKGVGALIIDRSIELEPLLHGGGQEKGARSGTENVAAIIGFGKAAELAKQEQCQRAKDMESLRDRLEEGLSMMPRVVVFADKAKRLPNTLQLGVDGVDGEMLLMQLDRRGIEVSSGSACSSEGKEPSHVLLSMGVEQELARSAIRVSLGRDNSENDVDKFLQEFKQTISRL
jgi:cysteine desulfurase